MKRNEDKMKLKLEARANQGNLRSLLLKSDLIDFCSNDYLGLARSVTLHKSVLDELNICEASNGSTGSRLLSGNTAYAELIESELATVFQTEAALLFSSGYQANLALLSSVPQKGDTVIYDELSHACIKDGIRLSFANRFAFRHNDLEDLNRKLSKATGDVFVVVESIYSMDGDQCPLAEITKLCERYKANLIVDEAHSTGIYGNDGSGLVCELKLENKVWARVHTFGKAMGVHGACVVGSEILIQYLINFARPFIYTTAMPLHSLAAIRASFSVLHEHMILQEEIKSVITYFREQCKALALPDGVELIESQSSIQALLVPGNERVKKISGLLEKDGYDVRPILSPTVKAGQERLRICLHVYNSKEEISRLFDSIYRHLKY